MVKALRDTETLIAPAVRDTINALDLAPEDAAAVRLAEQYAASIDAAHPVDRQDTLDKLGPKLLACLAELGATPAARSKLAKRDPGGGEQTDFERLRNARRAREA